MTQYKLEIKLDSGSTNSDQLWYWVLIFQVVCIFANMSFNLPIHMFIVSDFTAWLHSCFFVMFRLPAQREKFIWCCYCFWHFFRSSEVKLMVTYSHHSSSIRYSRFHISHFRLLKNGFPRLDWCVVSVTYP